jgi:hypothetical protein
MGRKRGVSQGSKLSDYIKKKPKKKKPSAWDLFTLEGGEPKPERWQR